MYEKGFSLELPLIKEILEKLADDGIYQGYVFTQIDEAKELFKIML